MLLPAGAFAVAAAPASAPAKASASPAETHEQAKARLVVAENKFKAAQEAKAAAGLNLVQAQRADEAAS